MEPARRRSALLLVALFSLLSSLVAAEVALRLARFDFDLAPKLEFGYPDPETLEDRYAEDPDLFYVPRDYGARLAALGARPPRLVFLGDSCTELGAYPRMLARRLARRHGFAADGWAKLGVAGWTTYQGLGQLRRDVVPLRPAVVTFYFGWNDHWRAFGLPDREFADLVGFGRRLPFEPRLWDLVARARIGWATRRGDGTTLRVPPGSFRHNLVEAVRTAREAGIRLVLLTAPTSHRRGAEPAYLEGRWIADLDRLVPLHQQYVDILREVARAEEAPLCDLEAHFAELPAAELAKMFLEDGIHFTREGDARASLFLARCFAGDPRLTRLWSEAPGDPS